MAREDESRPLSKAGPATNTTYGSPSISRTSDEAWVIRERRALREAKDCRVELWLALGLRVHDPSDGLVVARAIGSVDRVLRRAAL